MNKFEIGKTYTTEPLSDIDAQIVTFTVAKVTDKSLITMEGKRYKINSFWNSKNKENNGRLFVRPFGTKYKQIIFA